MKVNIAEYTFANLYLFRESHHYKLVDCGDLFVSGVTHDGVCYIMPTRVPQELDLCKMRKFLQPGQCIFPIAEEWLQFFDPRYFHYTYVEEDSDYLFALNKMRTYPGRALSGRRNLVHQFQNLYRVESAVLHAETTNDALIALEKWVENKNEDADYKPCLEGLKLFDTLKLSGKIYYEKGKPIAFIFGEQLNESVYVIHFAKADTQYKGVYQYMYQDFALHLPDRFALLNLEQDLGLPYLRKSKNAYQPDLHLKKYRVFLQKKSCKKLGLYL